MTKKEREEQYRIKMLEMKAFDREKACGRILAGVDEVGRGPLAGPVYAAAVILDDNVVIERLRDSKKLSEKLRESLFDEIKEKALAYSICSVDEKEIDEVNILQATFNAMKKAVNSLGVNPEIVLVDGNRDPGLGIETITVVKGDDTSMAIAAASVLAKVSRDRFMTELAKEYPDYGFEKHKGYPTKEHYDAIKEHGVSDVHRRSFRLYK